MHVHIVNRLTPAIVSSWVNCGPTSQMALAALRITDSIFSLHRVGWIDVAETWSMFSHLDVFCLLGGSSYSTRLASCRTGFLRVPLGHAEQSNSQSQRRRATSYYMVIQILQNGKSSRTGFPPQSASSLESL